MMPDQSAFFASVGRAGSFLSKSSKLISFRPSSSFSRISKGIAPPAGLSPGIGAKSGSKVKTGGEAIYILPGYGRRCHAARNYQGKIRTYSIFGREASKILEKKLCPLSVRGVRD